MPRYDVVFFEKENGAQPAKEFLLGVDVKMRAKMSNVIRTLSDYGHALREPYSKHISDGIFELRAKSDRTYQEFCSFSMSTTASSSQMDLSKRLKRHLPQRS